ncbi:DUF4754 domain-containing protein [Citrobacter sp. TSA-1]|nr:DUF4754 domain-containing protein [Citrobacter sp. TSA-1]
MQLVNDLLERHDFSLYIKGSAGASMQTESLIRGLQGLRQAAFCADDATAFQELSHLIIRAESGDHIQPYNMAVAA